MKPFVKKTLIGVAALVCYQLLGLILMGTYANAVGWILGLMVLPVLAGAFAGLFGFTYWSTFKLDDERKREAANPGRPSPVLRNYKRVMVWIFLGWAVFDLSRSITALMFVSPAQWDRQRILVATGGLLFGGFLVFVALRIQQSIKPAASAKEGSEDSSIPK